MRIGESFDTRRAVHGTVQKLDETLIDQIAAGEVVERPANVVKELIENAIDAGASAITVAVVDGGQALIRVSDDGTGMSAADASLCIERHATSKIASFEDLLRVKSLGFRGEALPSIGAVSRLTIRTRRHDDLEGTEVCVVGGRVESVRPHGGPAGTTVEVEDLFFNVPARRKFLRARQTETSKVFEICQRTALILPSLSMTVLSEGRTARRYPTARTPVERAYQVLGEMPLESIEARRDGMALHALLAPPSLARPGARHLFLYANGRPIVDRRLARAVAFAFGDRLPPGHYPRGLVALTVPTDEIDVNAHPQKTEVRFRRPAHVFDQVTRILGTRVGPDRRAQGYWENRLASDPPSRALPRDDSGILPIGSMLAEATRDYGAPPSGGVRLLGELRQRYLLCEGADRLYLLDRGKLQVALGYARLTAAAASAPLRPQELLFPDRLELESAERSTLESHAELLATLGFDCSPIGDRSYAVRAIPSEAGRASAAQVVGHTLAAIAHSPSDPKRAALIAIAESAVTPPTESLDPAHAAALVAKLSVDDEAFRAALISELRLPLGPDAQERVPDR